ncbi:Zn-finger in ubiquitin-hydrolases and other protein [Jannaschia donghaensis]|uniref:Zn-finger in ubiquitin-hydrolases and other protein n=1 Tax=Jannaschia donghaensis TaxID=420998 RepID=A0A0M6YET7_9RHOB|nr:Zn-finger in ubiquitin-hydrolases and other protein [Jannaschia donghaensis]
MSPCPHRDRIAVPALKEDAKRGLVCAECAKIGGEWVHLRQCRTCDAVLCCDDSPNRHARAHAEGQDHPIITSAEPGEIWTYCYVDDAVIGRR